ncbi:hypothetical protein H0H81_010536 [Sphagnurus paluster]|uniref:Uncharacterized protein n=1 Tax=Sphagnurus paluster TaxID=117069 RepID=A0A9P7FP89_9AGAR|nr:hypothetical protein H0H81_010536 [Sphagnurus paluster]
MEHYGDDSSDELEYHQEDQPPTPTTTDILKDMLEALNISLDACKSNGKSPAYAILPSFVQAILDFWTATKPNILEGQLKAFPQIKKLVDKSVSEAIAAATPPPPPPPTMEAPRLLHEATPRPRQPPHLAAVTPPQTNPGRMCPQACPPPPPSQPAPKPTYAAALRSKAPHPRKAHPPTKLVAPATTKWVIIPTNKSQLRDTAKRPSPLHIVSAINHKLSAWANESIGGVHVTNLGDSHILAATWMVGCNLLLTAAKTPRVLGTKTDV